MMIHGIQIMKGMAENDWEMAKLIALPVIKPFENKNIKITGSGFVPKTDSTGRPAFPSLKLDYAKRLVASAAFIPNKDYQVVTGMDEETLETIIMEIIPTDPQVRKHFEETLKNFS